jgi:hypothetical protein
VAKVRFWLREAYYGHVPEVCVRCGEPATVFRDRTIFTGLLGLPCFVLPPYVVIWAGKRWVRLPFCERHKDHWRWRRWTAWSIFALAILLMFAAFLFTIRFPLPQWQSLLAGLLCVGGFGLLVLWLVLIATLKLTGIFCVTHDDVSVTLAGIAPAFAERLEEKRREEAALYENALHLTWRDLRLSDRPALPSDGIQRPAPRRSAPDDRIQPGS